MNEPKAPLWERDPEGYCERAKRRILAKVEKDPETECWVWSGAARRNNVGVRKNRPSQGRPVMSFRGGANKYAYRVAYVLWVGEYPEGLETDHVCNNRMCVNPWHVEPVTHQENVRRHWARRSA